jgi:hypothetical protein
LYGVPDRIGVLDGPDRAGLGQLVFRIEGL